MGVSEGRSESEQRYKKYERIFVISFLSLIVLIICSVVVVAYTGFKFVTYLLVPILVNVSITNAAQKKYKGLMTK
ncbi:hypothetical protein [Bacillus gaemokensis]|uniref:Uncharacterized protein n=1 Tax=Bacillus gaemokensis TaxID=574375 RepID=A0A073K6H8_9BACI|nr:hypothetical protein [Bacillus gaemokensis]KEK22146.1 hypothetical protein BAGA_20940 [Bacillus gaemokensis]KYG35583.1 hypothetical protein AZF08_26265 [Bacillus gaemokensis]